MAFWGGQIIDNPNRIGHYRDDIDGKGAWLNGYPTEQLTTDGFIAQLGIVFPYSQRFSRAFEFRGGLDANGNRLRPMQYEPFRMAVCTGVDIRPFMGVPAISGSADSVVPVTYQYAVMIATFETVGWEGAHLNNSPQYLNVDEEFDGSAEFLTLPARDLYWDQQATDSLKEAEAPAAIDRKGVWTVTIRNAAPGLIPSAIWDFVGKTNAVGMRSERHNRVFEPETLQWMMPVKTEAPAADGVRAYHISIPLSHDPKGWNKLYRPGTDFAAGKSPVYDPGGVQKRWFPPVDFRSVLDMFPAV